MSEIVAKKYGRNLVIVIDGVKKTKIINTDKDKKDEESIKNKILLYNKKNNKMLKEEILYLIDTNKAKNDEVEAKAKGLKKSIKKETKKLESKQIIKSNIDLLNEIDENNLSELDTKRLEVILAKSKANQKATTSIVTTTPTPKKGEW